MPSAALHDLLFARARALDERGCTEAATQAYLDILAIDPSHFGALTGFGALAVKTGHRAAAKTAFARAAADHPHLATAHINLAIILCDEGDPIGAKSHFETALGIDAGNRIAHQGMAVLFLRLGEPEQARHHARAAFDRQADAWPYRGAGRPVSLLLILSAAGANVPIDPFIDDRVFQRWTVTAEFFDPDAELPPHDVVFNGVGDADRCAVALDAATAIVSRSRARVLNTPPRVGATGRAANACRLAQIPGVVVPLIAPFSRESLLDPSAPDAVARAGFAWPLLLRSPGFHGGENFVQVGGPRGLAAAVADIPGETLFVIQFVDTRSADGNYRKYRVMTVGGQLYPLHLAISARWKVHYFTSDMADRADHRAEDEAFLNDMPGMLGPQAMRALLAVQSVIGLDYGGIDFSRDASGNLVVFEANATMTIAAPGTDERWRYRASPVRRVERAVTRMLLNAAGRLDCDTEGAFFK